MKEFWNQRYEASEFVYGENPSSFFSDNLWYQYFGRILLPGEGEGRNAVHAAKNGWLVHAFDYSEVAAAKAISLSRRENVKIEYEIADVKSFETAENYYHLISISFMHLFPDLRKSFHEKLTGYLRPGGKLIAEYFSRKQINYNTGGPRNPEMLYDVEELRQDFSDLHISYLSEEVISLDENEFHDGQGSVIRLIAEKPEE
jgi:SAM-dependent methyltransferase